MISRRVSTDWRRRVFSARLEHMPRVHWGKGLAEIIHIAAHSDALQLGHRDPLLCGGGLCASGRARVTYETSSDLSTLFRTKNYAAF